MMAGNYHMIILYTWAPRAPSTGQLILICWSWQYCHLGNTDIVTNHVHVIGVKDTPIAS